MTSTSPTGKRITCRRQVPEGLDRSPLWNLARNEPEFKRIRERVKKDHDEKMKKYGSLE